MPTNLTQGNLSRYEGRLVLKNGSEVFLRPILETDAGLILDLFKKLSPRSVYLRFLRHLDALPEDMIFRFTHINYSSEFALVAMIKEDGKDAMIAVGRYAHDPDENLAELAVAVRDDWQHLGLGKSLLAKVVDIGRERGISRFIGMMDPRNKVIKRILVELGYDVRYVLRSGSYRVEIAV